MRGEHGLGENEREGRRDNREKRAQKYLKIQSLQRMQPLEAIAKNVNKHTNK